MNKYVDFEKMRNNKLIMRLRKNEKECIFKCDITIPIHVQQREKAQAKQKNKQDTWMHMFLYRLTNEITRAVLKPELQKTNQA